MKEERNLSSTKIGLHILFMPGVYILSISGIIVILSTLKMFSKDAVLDLLRSKLFKMLSD